MSTLLKTKTAWAAAGIVCLALGNAWAQQAIQQQSERDDTTIGDRTNDRPGLGQINGRTQEHSAQYRGTQPTAGGQSEQVAKFLSACLLAKNEAEIELGQFAQEHAQNPQVKKFAQQMVQDHTRLVEKLRSLAGQESGQHGQTTASPSLENGQRQVDAQRQAADTTRLPGSPGSGQPASGATATGQDVRKSLNQSLTSERQAGQADQAISQLIRIDRQIVERHGQAIREELQDKQGADFDMAYVGSQVAGHMQMLAALEVIEQQGPDQLRQIAQQARPMIQEHLQHAKQLKEQLRTKADGSSSQAERQSTRTQR